MSLLHLCFCFTRDGSIQLISLRSLSLFFSFVFFICVSSCPCWTLLFVDAQTCSTINSNSLSLITLPSQCTNPSSIYQQQQQQQRSIHHPDPLQPADSLYATCDQSGVVKIHMTSSDGNAYGNWNMSSNSTSPTSIVTTIASAQQCRNANSVSFDDLHQILFMSCVNNNNGFGEVLSFNGSALTTVLTSAQCLNPFHLIADSTAGVLYVACGGASTIIALQNNIITTLTTTDKCKNPYALFKDSGTDTLLAACSNNNNLNMSSSSVIAINVTSRIVTTLATSQQCLSARSVVRDGKTGLVYAACYSSAASIIAINSTTAQPHIATVVASAQCPNAVNLFIDQTRDRLIAACQNGGVLSLPTLLSSYSLSSPSTVATIASSAQCLYPTSLNVNPWTGDVFVACNNELGSIVRIDGSSVTNLASLAQCYSIHKEAGQGLIYAACDIGVLALMDNTVTVLLSANDCPNPYSVVKDSTQNVLYAACNGNDGGIKKIALNDTSVTTLATFTQCPNPTSIFLRSDNNILYAACNNGEIISIHISTVNTVVSSSICPRPYFVSYDNSTNSLFATCVGSNSIIKVRNGTVQTLSSSSSCRSPYSVYIDPNTQLVYVACFYGNVISINQTDVNVRTVISSTLCLNPVTVFKDENGLVFVTCFNDGILTLNETSGIITKVASPTQCPRSIFLLKDPVTQLLYATCKASGIVAIGFNYICPDGYAFTDGQCSLCPSGFALATSLSPSWKCQECVSGTHAAKLGASGCSLCSIGTFQNLSAASSCLACEPGKFQNKTGQPDCLPVPIGSYSLEVGAWTFSQCPAGSYTNTTGSKVCIPCTAGRYQPEAGSSRCEDCAVGTYSAQSNAVRCASCEIGKYASLNQSLSCVPCPVGHFQLLPGQSRCDPCSAGWFSDGQTPCTPCSAGSFASNSSSAVCSVCQPGSFSNTEAAIQCTPCSLGFISTRAGSTRCFPCPQGTYSDTTTNNQTCLPCIPGTFNPLEAQSSCSKCAKGRFAPDYNSTACTDCDFGTFSLEEGRGTCQICFPGSYINHTGSSTVCSLCSAGYHQRQEGASTCVQCNVQTYTDRLGSSQCSPCPTRTNPERTMCLNVTTCQPNHELIDDICHPCALGTFSSGSGSCKTCPINTYTPRRGSDCLSCASDSGLTCSGGLAYSKTGFWAYVAFEPFLNLSIFRTSSCPYDLCPGILLQNASAADQVSFLSNRTDPKSIESSGLDQQCAFPRINSANNVLCGTCMDGYVEWANSCVQCKDTRGEYIFVLLLISIVLVIFLYRSTMTSTGAAETQIFLYFLQTAMLELGNNTKFLDWLKWINLSADSTPLCLGPLTTYQQTLLNLLIPFILLMELGCMAIIHKCLQFCLRSSSSGSGSGSGSGSDSGSTQFDAFVQRAVQWSQRFSIHPYIGAVLAILLFCYTSIATTCIRFLYCHQVNEARVVFAAPSMDCDSATYREYSVVVWIFY